MAERSPATPLALVALVLSAAALTFSLSGKRGTGQEGPDDARDLLGAASLENRLNDVEGRLEKAEKAISEMGPRLGRAEKVADTALRQAEAAESLARAGGATPKGIAQTDQAPVPVEATKRREELDLLLAGIRGGNFSPENVYGLMVRAKDLGGLDEAIEEVKKFVEAHPADVAALVALGTAYAAKIPTLADGAERKAWAEKGIDAYDRALLIDKTNWEAQYYRSFNLAQWPAILNKRPEAIRGFEALLEQQEKGGIEPRFANSYVHLGVLYQQVGNAERAKAIFRKGLDLFPDHKALREQIDLIEKR